MSVLENWLNNNRLSDPDDLDALLETAELTRQLIHDRDYSGLNTVIVYTIGNSLYEAFSWITALLQEEFGKTDGYALDDFECEIGTSIPDYDGLADSLQIDFSKLKNDVENVYDERGEIESFFSNSTYPTGYGNIFFMSSENFDNKDHDYILYKLLFRR
ncbi:MAG: hypothetical protein K5629_03940 [Eubacteriales bacterium]|nr:hypothetical protein [Eubacteriales bacterium]